jgi:GNAT superfamily N-acetyltransferase
MALTVRPLVLDDPADVAALQSLLLSAPDYTMRITGHGPRPGDAVDVLTIHPPSVDPAMKQGLGLWDDTLLVAFADVLFGYPDHRHAFIGLLVVHGNHRGQGHGRRMHEVVLSAARQANGIERMRLGIVDTNAAQAEPFWSALGYEATGETKPYEHDDVTSTVRLWAQPLDLLGEHDR